MTIRDEDIDLRLQVGEDSRWEFKQIAFRGDHPVASKDTERTDWANEIVAFANADGGNLLFGVTDDGEVQDMSPKQSKNLCQILTDLSADLKPPVRIGISQQMSPEHKLFLWVRVPKGELPHASSDGAYVRAGASKQKITGDELLRLAQDRGQARFRWFDEQPVPETGFRTLDENLWKPLLSAEAARNPETGLRKIELLAPDEHGVRRATVAGILVCSKAPEQWLPNACIRATRYRGNDQASGQLDTRTFGGPVNSQIEGALSFVHRNMQVAARKEPGRIDMPQYSERALFEAVVNAVAHRDYSIKGSSIRLLMFEDRLEIRSPGALPNNLTVEGMSERQSTRNEVLVSVLARMRIGDIAGAEHREFFMERRGDGVPVIFRETKELSGNSPEYHLVDGSELCLVIPAASVELSPASVVITAHQGNRPHPGVDILVLFPNHTWKRATTDKQGNAIFDLHSTHLPMTVFAASDGFAAHLERDWMPAERVLAIELDALPAGGSVIFSEATGHIPGLSGQLDPIRDTLGRTYLYTSNVSINQGQAEPVYFVPGEDLRLTDANGREKRVRIVGIQGRSALVEHRPLREEAET